MHPSAEVTLCLEPQERFERLRAHHLRRTGGKLADLAYPNAEDGPAVGVREVLRAAIEGASGLDLQYTPYGGATVPRRIVARSLERTRGARFSYDDVVLTPGAMSALAIVMAAARESEDDQLVIVAPCWLDSRTYAYQQGFTPVLAYTHRESGRLDLDAIARALSPRTRAVLLMQPSNPMGVLHDRDALLGLAHLLAAQPVPPLLISDECHSDYVLGGAVFVSPIALYPRTCIVCSLGKRWLAQGLRLGFAAFGPALRTEGWAARATRLCRALGHAIPSALLQRALPRLYELDIDRTPIALRRELARTLLESSGYRVLPGRHTMFVYADVPGGGDDFEFVERAAQAGVLVMPSSLFSDTGRFRIAVTAGDETLARGLDALARVAEERAAA